MNYDGVMSNCGVMHIPDVMWNVIEMQNVCGVPICGMLHNARCGMM